MSKEDIKKHMRVRDKIDLTRPVYYKEGVREARKLLRELKKSH